MTEEQRYQYMPAMAEADFDRLKQSIKDHGFLPGHEIVTLEDGTILDGHHRHRACQELGIVPPTRVVDVPDDARWDYVYLTNVPRRHLDAVTRTALVREYLRRHPGESNRAVAAASGISPTTVGKIRAEADDLDVSPETYSRAVKSVHVDTLPDDGSEPPQETANHADHKGECWFELTIGYPAPSDEERVRAGVPYPKASERFLWHTGPLYLVSPAPEGLTQAANLSREIAERIWTEIKAKPLKTMPVSRVPM